MEKKPHARAGISIYRFDHESFASLYQHAYNVSHIQLVTA